MSQAASRQVPSRGEANFLCGRRRRRCGQPTRRSSAASIGSAPLAHHSVPELTHDCDPGRLGMGPFAFRCWMLRIPTANQFSFFVFGLIPLPCCSDLGVEASRAANGSTRADFNSATIQIAGRPPCTRAGVEPVCPQQRCEALARCLDTSVELDQVSRQHFRCRRCGEDRRDGFGKIGGE